VELAPRFKFFEKKEPRARYADGWFFSGEVGNSTLELVQVSASSYKWSKFTPISLQKCSGSAAILRFLRLIGANFSSLRHRTRILNKLLKYPTKD
jgi:hypothetical protein